MRIAVDAMGGDKGPAVVARGAVEAAKLHADDLHIILVGDEERVRKALKHAGPEQPNIEVVHASEVVDMCEPPARAIRKKKDSSIAVAMRLVKAGGAEALVSVGNTGAVVAGSLVTLGRLHGVSRPALMTFYSTKKGWTVFLDIGANYDCTPKNLYQFAVMGSVFAEYQLEVSNPRVGLLNIGEEASKGTEMVRAAHQLMLNGNINFVGNVEGRDVFDGTVDVVVCDGFVGNILLKFTERILSYTNDVLRREIRKSLRAKLGAMLMKNVFRSFRANLDTAEYGGAPLIGIRGVVIVAHGKSTARDAKNAILMGRKFVRLAVNDHIEERFRGQVSDIVRVR